MSDLSDASDDDELQIFYERRTQEVQNINEKSNIQTSTESDSEIQILSNQDKNIENRHTSKVNSPNEIFQNKSIDRPTIDESDSSNDSVQICSSPINHDFPTLFDNLSSSQPTPVSSEPFKRQDNSQPIVFSVGTESDSDDSEKSDFQDLSFDHLRNENQNSLNSQENFNFSFPFSKNQQQPSQTKQTRRSVERETYRVTTATTQEAEKKFRNRIELARKNFINEVQEAIKELNAPIPLDVDISRPPIYEAMNNDELRSELAGFGFRFKSREDAISKLFRCWSALREKETSHQTNLHFNKPNNTHLNPIDFIRIHSKFYEQILVYQPIPLASLFREMTEAGIKITINRLKSILDDEGVAFTDDANAIYPAK